MAGITVDTTAVTGTATNLQRLNRELRDNFSGVARAVTRLDGGWDGQAAAKAIRRFSDMQQRLTENRYQALDNYARFLCQQVGVGYEETEGANKSLADAFK